VKTEITKLADKYTYPERDQAKQYNHPIHIRFLLKSAYTLLVIPEPILMIS